MIQPFSLFSIRDLYRKFNIGKGHKSGRKVSIQVFHKKNEKANLKQKMANKSRKINRRK